MPDHDSPQFSLVVPFTACRSSNGPYDDDAFVAGFRAGQIDQALAVASTMNAATVRFDMVHTALVPQVELLAMSHGYPVMTVDTSEEWPEWSTVTFADRAQPEGGDVA